MTNHNPLTENLGGEDWVYPDTLVGTDSHTTMINGLGCLGWGVGGIEAEAAMLGQPCSMLIPQVVGFKLTGRLPAGTPIVPSPARIDRPNTINCCQAVNSIPKHWARKITVTVTTAGIRDERTVGWNDARLAVGGSSE